MAWVIVMELVLLFVDELIGVLDSTSSCEVLVLFDELLVGGWMVVMIMYEVDVVEYVKRIVCMCDGQIIFDIC